MELNFITLLLHVHNRIEINRYCHFTINFISPDIQVFQLNFNSKVGSKARNKTDPNGDFNSFCMLEYDL